MDKQQTQSVEGRGSNKIRNIAKITFKSKAKINTFSQKQGMR